MTTLRTRVLAFLAIPLLIILLTSYSLLESHRATAILDPLPIFGKGPPETTKSGPATSEPIPAKVETPQTEKPPKEDPAPPPPPPPPPEPSKHVIPDHPIYKPQREPLPPVVENFPYAAAAHSAEDLPPIPPWNTPPKPHVPEKTPLFIGFTRNWRLLQQTVVSYITAGWPPEDIYVFENTGTMDSNKLGQLSLQNPFFLNHTRLHMFGVNIIVAPTLFTFAQLQNFYLWTAIQNNYTTYFWSHMDVLAVGYEYEYGRAHPELANSSMSNGTKYDDYKSLYKLCVDALRNATGSEPDPNSSDPTKTWGIRMFSYDRLALVNRAAFEAIGGWDVNIPYYVTDCDMHDRIVMYGYEYNGPDVKVGNITDVGTSLDDLMALYRKKDTVEGKFTIPKSAEQIAEEKEAQKKQDEEGKTTEKTAEEKIAEEHPNEKRLVPDSKRKWVSDYPGSPSYHNLFMLSKNMTDFKNKKGGGGRNFWQGRQGGGQGEPYYRDHDGFERALQMTAELGRNVYAEKWGHRDCGLLEFGRKAGDEWRVEKDWE